jgi:hypothetical protein
LFDAAVWSSKTMNSAYIAGNLGRAFPSAAETPERLVRADDKIDLQQFVAKTSCQGLVVNRLIHFRRVLPETTARVLTRLPSWVSATAVAWFEKQSIVGRLIPASGMAYHDARKTRPAGRRRNADTIASLKALGEHCQLTPSGIGAQSPATGNPTTVRPSALSRRIMVKSGSAKIPGLFFITLGDSAFGSSAVALSFTPVWVN